MLNDAFHAADPEPSDVRFGMRGLLLTMTVVAIAMGLLGSSYRNLQPESRGTVAVMWGICAAIIVGRVGYCAWLRVRLERMAGHTICAIAPRGTFGFARRPWMTVLIGLFLAGLGVYYVGLSTLVAGQGPPGAHESLELSLLPCIMSGALISWGIVTICWNRTVQIREHGVLRGLQLLRWSHITKHRWVGDTVFFEGVDQRHRDVQLVAVANADRRQELTRLVSRKISSPGWLALQRTLGSDEAKEQMPLVRIQPRHEVTFRGTATAFFTYMMLIVFMAFRPWGAPSRDFMAGFGIGIAGPWLWLLIGARRAGDAGAPLVRLNARLDWLSVLIALAAAVGCYYVNQQLLFFNSYVSIALGIGSGIGASVLAGMMTRERYDLCDNGVMLIRWTFLPWQKISVLSWNPLGNGVLLLRSGWRRLAAKVPKQHREVVDRVLREKVGLN